MAWIFRLCAMSTPMGLLVILVLVLSACGERGPVTQAGAKPGSGASSSSDSTANAEALQRSLRQHLDRMRNLVTFTTARIQSQQPNNHVRRACLLWQIQTGEVCLEMENHNNLLVALVQTWYWSVAMERFMTTGEGRTLFANFQAEASTATITLRKESEALAQSFLEPAPFAALKTRIEAAAGNGELFTATSQDRDNIFQDVLGATHLESLFGLVLAPFNALTGVGKGGTSMEDIARAANHAVVLGERYPQMLGLHLQLAAIEMQEQDAASAALKDLHTLTATGERMGETLRTLPEELRRQAQVLLESSGPAQTEARATLERVRDAGTALEKAATAIDAGLKTLDQFIAHTQHAAATNSTAATASAQETAPTNTSTQTSEQNHPFRIDEYTTAFAQAETLAQELRRLLDSLKSTLNDPVTDQKLGSLLDGRLAAARAETKQVMDQAHHDATQIIAEAHTQADQLLGRAQDHAQQIIDHAAWRVVQLLIFAVFCAVLGGWLLKRVSSPAGAPRS